MVLTELQRRFAAEYVACAGNAAEAARRAGSVARRQREAGRELLTNPAVQQEIQRLSAPVIAEQQISAERTLREIATIAYGTLDEIAPWDEQGPRLIPSDQLTREQRAMVASIKVKRERRAGEPEWEVEHYEIRPWDKLRALETLARIQKLIGDTVQPVVNDNRTQIAVGSLSDDQLAALLAIRTAAD